MKSALRAFRRDESGQVIVLVAVMMLGLIAVVGLVTDGGLMFTQRRDLQNAADGAALAGAMQIDESKYRASGGSSVTLNESEAYSATVAYLEGEGGVVYSVVVRSDRVEVSVSRRASTGFLRVLGITGFEISAGATAQPRHGIASAAP